MFEPLEKLHPFCTDQDENLYPASTSAEISIVEDELVTVRDFPDVVTLVPSTVILVIPPFGVTIIPYDVPLLEEPAEQLEPFQVALSPIMALQQLEETLAE